MIKVYQDILEKEQKDYLNNNILNNNIPYYINKKQTLDDNRLNFTHLLQNRDTREITSDIYYDVIKIINSLCKKTNTKIKHSLRACINLTFPYNPSEGAIHLDHNFAHKQFIIYLTDGGATHFFDKNKKLIKKIKSKKYKVVLFDKQYHAVVHPKKGIRIIIVVTFV